MKRPRNNFTYAIVVRSEYRSNHIDFINDENDLLQVGYMSHNKDHKIIPHDTKIMKGILMAPGLIIQGQIRTNFFDENSNHVCSVTLNKGDLILLLGGAHGFDVLEDLSMIEAKTVLTQAIKTKQVLLIMIPVSIPTLLQIKSYMSMTV